MRALSSRQSRPTLKDVAERAGVSTATVARVLHGNGYVADETRKVVEAVVEETGYQINAVAQGLRKQRTFTLGHVLQSIAPNPFFAGVALGVEKEATQHGCGVVLYTTQGDAERERKGVETLIRRRVDAIIFTKIAHEANVELAARAGIPVVQVERVCSVPTDSVTADNYPGALEATRHLIELGHEKIAFLGVAPPPSLELDAIRSTNQSGDHGSVERERLSGYMDALAAAQIPLREGLVDLSGSYYALDWARATMRGMLELPAGSRPTAVFATCDMLAAGVLQEIHAHGMRVPDDISVVGFDDTYASYLTPPLSTARQPMFEMGQAAARLAIEALQAAPDHRVPRCERMSTHLVVRESTGQVSRSGKHIAT